MLKRLRIVKRLLWVAIALSLLLGLNPAASGHRSPLSAVSSTLPVTVPHAAPSPTDAIADITIWPSYGELSDPTSPYFEAVRSLVERYGVDVSLPDGTLRPEEPLKRGDFMIYLDRALSAMEVLMNSRPEPSH